MTLDLGRRLTSIFRLNMKKLPLFAYNLMKGHYEVFPIELLEAMGNVGENERLGFTWCRAHTSPPHWHLLNNFGTALKL